MTTDTQLNRAIDRLEDNEARVDVFVNGTENSTWTTTEGVSMPSIRGLLKGLTLPVFPLADYNSLRNYSGVFNYVEIQSPSIFGTFYKDSSDTTSVDNGGTVIVSQSGVRWKRVYSGAVYAEWFGAKPSSTFDSTSSFQAALNFSPSVKFGPGEYLVGSLTMSDGQTFEGVGRSSVLLVKSGTTDPIIKISGTNFTTGKVARTLLQNFLIYDNFNTQAVGIYLQWVEYAFISNVIVRGTRRGSEVMQCGNVTFRDCSILDCSNIGLVTGLPSGVTNTLNSWLNLINCSIAGNLAGILLRDMASAVLDNVKVLSNKDYGIQADKSIGNVAPSTLILIDKCDIDSNWGAGIRFFNINESTISNTWVSGGRTQTQNSTSAGGFGMYFSNSKGISLIGNKIFDNGNHGVFIVDSDGVTISSNTIKGSGLGAGVRTENSSNLSLVGNTISAAGFTFTSVDGISMTTGSSNTIVANTIGNHTGQRIYTTSSSTRVYANPGVTDTTNT